MLLSVLPVTNADKVLVNIRNDIVSGVIPAGSKLNEAELAHKYEVSRAVVREAVNRLESSRLVERKPNVGARVIEISGKGLIELYQIRESLEGMAARLAAQNMSNDEIDSLVLLLEKHQLQINGSEDYYQEAGDLDFHYRIIVGSQNQQLISLLLDGIYHLIRMYRVQLSMSGPRVATALSEHIQIATAIQNKDAELAEILMRRHIQYTRENLNQLYFFQ